MSVMAVHTWGLSTRRSMNCQISAEAPLWFLGLSSFKVINTCLQVVLTVTGLAGPQRRG